MDTRRGLVRYSVVAGLGVVLVASAAAHIGRQTASVAVIAGAERQPVAPQRSHHRAPARQYADRAPDLASLDIVSQPPSVIYADARAFSFNTGYGSTVRPDLLVSLDASKPDAAIADGTWQIAFAKTVTFFFAPDSGNTRVKNAFALWREVNDGSPQILVRNVLPDTLPFFVYKSAAQDPGGDSLAEVPAERLPITFADSSEAGIDAQSIRAVELHFLVTNGEKGAAQKVERVSVVAMLPGGEHPVQPVVGQRSGAVAGMATYVHPRHGPGLVTRD